MLLFTRACFWCTVKESFSFFWLHNVLALAVWRGSVGRSAWSVPWGHTQTFEHCWACCWSSSWFHWTWRGLTLPLVLQEILVLLHIPWEMAPGGPLIGASWVKQMREERNPCRTRGIWQYNVLLKEYNQCSCGCNAHYLPSSLISVSLSALLLS